MPSAKSQKAAKQSKPRGRGKQATTVALDRPAGFRSYSSYTYQAYVGDAKVEEKKVYIHNDNGVISGFVVSQDAEGNPEVQQVSNASDLASIMQPRAPLA